MENNPDSKKVILGLFLGTALIGLIVYGSYSFSRKPGQEAVTSQSSIFSNSQKDTPPTAPLRFSAEGSTPWTTYQGVIYPYSFSYPQTLDLETFPDDNADSVAIKWGNIPLESNILLNIEFINQRDPQYNGNVEEYARNWWKFYSGLKGVASVDKFTNSQGMIGYRAVYINTSDQTPNIDIFFEVPDNKELAIRLANGILDPAIFNRIVESLKWETSSSASAPQE